MKTDPKLIAPAAGHGVFCRFPFRFYFASRFAVCQVAGSYFQTAIMGPSDLTVSPSVIPLKAPRLPFADRSTLRAAWFSGMGVFNESLFASRGKGNALDAAVSRKFAKSPSLPPLSFIFEMAPVMEPSRATKAAKSA